MIEPQSAQDGASSWILKAVRSAPSEAARADAADTLPLPFPCRCRWRGRPSPARRPGGRAFRRPPGALPRPTRARRLGLRRRDRRGPRGGRLRGPRRARRVPPRRTARAPSRRRRTGTRPPGRRAPGSQGSPVVADQEAAPEPAEDVVDDRLRDRDLAVAGEAGRLEPDVGELVHQVAERYAVLEGQADGGGERVHQARDR